MSKYQAVVSVLMFVFFWKNSVDGQVNFVAQTIDADVDIGYGLAIGDVDGDGDPDIMLADKQQFIWYRNPDWKPFVFAQNLTERDNVCLAARDIDGDGLVEIAVGGQWNPGETMDAEASGSVHFLQRPKDPTQEWKPIKLHHEPTVHRMRWIKTEDTFQLVVLPLHGRGNRGGSGAGVRVYAYQVPAQYSDSWQLQLVDSSMHVTHNLDVFEVKGEEVLVIGGKEGAKFFRWNNGTWIEMKDEQITDMGFGEIRKGKDFLAGVQPFHGETLAVYPSTKQRIVLTSTLKQGHALACADLLSLGFDQVVVGWRNENEDGDVGIKVHIPETSAYDQWKDYWIDQNGMACEDLKVVDLDGDDRLDIIAAGRSSHNLKIYWNKN
ncbi:MAG: hypothetical protein HKN87_02595 [Saprospiraceae bacterium]|nr:hypothetical protein [Saprospiraceae bacterium]